MNKQNFPRTRYVWFAVVVAVGLLADLGTKSWTFSQFGLPGEYGAPEQHGIYWLIPDVFGIQTSLNEGALFGMGQGFASGFCVISIVAIAVILLWLFWFGQAKSLFWTCVFGMMTAGGIGNMYDRLGIPGLLWNYPSPLHEVGQPVYAVRDWILVMIGSYHWPNFNIADSLLVVGAICVAMAALFEKNESAKTGETEPAKPEKTE